MTTLSDDLLNQVNFTCLFYLFYRVGTELSLTIFFINVVVIFDGIPIAHLYFDNKSNRAICRILNRIMYGTKNILYLNISVANYIEMYNYRGDDNQLHQAIFVSVGADLSKDIPDLGPYCVALTTLMERNSSSMFCTTM